MIEYTTGDILRSDTEALVNPVNCVGVMGQGLAAQFKRMFPENFRAYEAACHRGEVRPGRLFVFATPPFSPLKWIINFPTKRHWKDSSRLADIESGLVALVEEIELRDIRSIAMPALGSGLGRLPWSTVRPLIESALGEIRNFRAVVFEPIGLPGATTASDAPAAADRRPG